MKINFKLLTNSLGKNLSHQPSTAPQDLQYGKLCEFSLTSWTLIALLKNHGMKIFLAFFNFRHLKNEP